MTGLLNWIYDDVQILKNDLSYPVYNVLKTSEDDSSIVIELALAGFTKEELTVNVNDKFLTVSGTKADETKGEYVHKGISTKSFIKKFIIGKYDVENVKFNDGILRIELRLPVAAQPKTIQIA